MAASLRVLTPLTRPIARRYLAPAIASTSGAYATRAFASKRSGTPKQGPDSQNSAQEESQYSSGASEPTSATSNGASETAGKTSDAPLTPPEPLSEALPASSVPSLDFSPGSPGSRTGARSARNTDGPTESQKRAGRLLTFAVATGLGVTIWNMGRDWEEEELKRRRKEPLSMDTGFSGFWKRVWHRAGDTVGLLSEPAWEELLPPPLPAPHQKPYTLLLSMDDLLVGSTWDRQHGWRTAKRPGVDYFIAYLSHFYEIVIFTSQPFFHAGPIVEKLDPYSFYIMYRLFREGTRFVDGKVVKDLSFLNRDLSKVVALDTHPEHYALQPENSIIVKPWDGKPGDSGLVALIPFLESIAIYKPDDVRPILEKYLGKDVPIEYAIEEAKHKEAFLQEWREKNKGRLNPSGGLGSGGFTISSLFGGGGTPHAVVKNEPLTYLEQKRKEAQQEYLAEQAYLRKNEGEIKKMIEDEMKERDRMAKEAGGSIAALVGTLINGPPDPSTLSAPAAPAPAGPPPSATQVLQGATQSGKQ